MKLLIDCDPGIDDALALCQILCRREPGVIGISTVGGNTSARQGAENVLRLLKLCGREGEIPVCCGAEQPLLGETKGYPVHIHGRNGLADAVLPASSRQPVPMEVCDFLYEVACRCEDPLTLVTLGRFTNVARTIRNYPDFPEKITRVVSMGGAVFTRGNITPEAEANIYGDPEAAQIALSAPWDLTLVGLDVTMKTFLSRSDLESLACGQGNQELGGFLTQILSGYAAFIRSKNPAWDGCPLHDPLAMLAAIDPTVVQTKRIPVRVDCSATATRGKILPGSGHPVRVCTAVEAPRAVREILSPIRQALRK